MNDATDIINSILANLPQGEGKPPVQHEYTGNIVSINSKTAKKIISSFLDGLTVKIGTGLRYNTSLQYAGLLWACGYSANDIKKTLVKFDTERNNPPKNNTDDIDKIISFIVTTPQGFKERKKKDATRTSVFNGDILAEAKTIYESGEFIKYCETAFSKVWYGDTHILRGVMYMTTVGRIKNSEFGIHLHISGDTQTGKSQSIKKSLKFISPNDWMAKSFSLKYLFYAPPGTLHKNTIVFSDDTQFDEETARFFRGILTSWSEGSDRGVVINHEGKDLSIPPRVSMILTSIDDVCQETDEAQDESRFLTLEIRRTDQQILEIKKFVQEPHPDISHELSVIHAVWSLIPETEVKRHKIVEINNTMREFHRYLELVTAHALLCNRTITNDNDFIAVDTFLTNSKSMINSTTAPLTRKEAAVLSILKGEKNKLNPKLTVGDIAEKTGMPLFQVYRALRGSKGTFNNPSGGLMRKEKLLTHEETRTADQNNVHSFQLRTPN